MVRLAFSILFCIIFGFSRPLFAEEMSAKEIIRTIDKLYRSQTSAAKMEMEIQTKEWQRQLKMDIFTEGMHKTFIVINYPLKDKGIATLRIGTEMWNYFPKIDKTIKIPPSMMMSGWMGSDFSNDDLVKESSLLDDYDHVLESDPAADKGHYVIVLTPKKSTISLWGKIVSIVDKATLLPSRQEFFDENGTKVRIMNFNDVREMGGRRIPTVLELIPLDKPNNKTVVRYIDIKFDTTLPSDTFSQRNLSRKR